MGVAGNDIAAPDETIPAIDDAVGRFGKSLKLLRKQGAVRSDGSSHQADLGRS
jgi:hypothetical protein